MKHLLSYKPPLETLGEVYLELETFIKDHPNPTSDVRRIRFGVTMGGKVRSIEIEDNLNER